MFQHTHKITHKHKHTHIHTHTLDIVGRFVAILLFYRLPTHECEAARENVTPTEGTLPIQLKSPFFSTSLRSGHENETNK